MKKFFKEFKAFITRGNVLDMAVGIIIGGAFTAIITALVGHILTPLINWIPGSDGTSALQLVLREPTLDETGAVIKEAIILDFGAVISAVVTFLITAFVLFLIVKTVNSVRAGGKKYRAEQDALRKAEYKQLRKELKAQGLAKREINAEILRREQEKAALEKAQQAQKEAEAAALEKAGSAETLLREIRDLLAANAGQTKNASADKEETTRA